MINMFKIKYLLSPVAVIVISVFLSLILNRMFSKSDYNIMTNIIFYVLFLYWFFALNFIVSRFVKNRRAT